MHPFARSHTDTPAPPHPWEQAHAAPADRAVGLELELIELVHRRGTGEAPADATTVEVDAQIDQVLADLAEVAQGFPIAG